MAIDTGTQFLEALEYLRRRLGLSSAEWRAVWAEAGGIAEAAADRISESIVRDVIAAVARVIEEGGTLADFRREYDRIAVDAGWTRTPAGAAWHSDLVFRLHVGSAYAAGRWEQAQRLAADQPGQSLYFRYITAGDHRVRPRHRAWHGVVLPVSHGFWSTHYPPNGFNCRCHAQLVRDRDLERYGWQMTADSDPRLAVPPDPGWDGNVGIAGERLAQLEATKPELSI